MKGRNKIIFSIIGIAVVFLLIYFKVKSPEAKHQTAGKTKIPTLVNAYLVSTQMLDNNVFATGTVIANNDVTLTSEVSGKVTKLLIDEGSKVKTGQLLVKLNDADLQAQLMKLKFQEKLAQENEFRQKKLLEAKGISQEEYDATLNALNTIKSDVELLKAQIDKTEIKAPFDGVIGLKYVYVGSYVSPSVKIASIQDIDPVKIDFSVPEKYGSYIHKGDVIDFTIQGSVDQNTGKVYAIEPKVDIVTRTIQMRAVCTNSEGKIFPGSFAKIHLVLSKIDNAVLIPTQAIISVLNGKRVYKYKNGKAIQQDVETGIRTDTQIQITSGVSAGDTIITTGFMQLRPGDKVRIMSYINQ